jgi:hypothetical protein
LSTMVTHFESAPACWKMLDNSAGSPSALRSHFQFIYEGQRFAYSRTRKNGCSAESNP